MSGDSSQKMVEEVFKRAFQMRVLYGTEPDYHVLLILSMRGEDVRSAPPLTEIPGHLLEITQKTPGDETTWTASIDGLITDDCVKDFLKNRLSMVHRNDHQKNPLLDRLIEFEVPGDVLVKTIAFVLLQAGFDVYDEPVTYVFSLQDRRMKPSSAQALLNLILRVAISPRRSVGSRLFHEVCFMLRCSDDNQKYRIGVTAEELSEALVTAVQNKPYNVINLFFCGTP